MTCWRVLHGLRLALAVALSFIQEACGPPAASDSVLDAGCVAQRCGGDLAAWPADCLSGSSGSALASEGPPPVQLSGRLSLLNVEARDEEFDVILESVGRRDARAIWRLQASAPAAEQLEALRFGAEPERPWARIEAPESLRCELRGELLGWPSWSELAVPEAPTPNPKHLRLVALNLHNYFDSLGERGASSAQELERQTQKLVALLGALRADVIALTELENSAAAPRRLLDALNAALARASASLRPAARYALAHLAPAAGPALRSAVLFQPNRVALAAAPRWLDAPAGARPALLQPLEWRGRRLSLVVVHFKSQRCPAPTEISCGAATREREAQQLAVQVDSLPGLLILGDFNARPGEAALERLHRGLRRAGLVDLTARLPLAERYSYRYRGEPLLLDRALSSERLASRARAVLWHINADELPLRDYRSYRPAGYYVPDARRASDHDPVVVDLEPW